ncbi:MAG: hypothetical protein HC863_01540, partial [Myxococcales bacterium]|nr:hypothetical protein [Myxococcales bacterium]
MLINADAACSFATRRILVDALKVAQNSPAYLALVNARAAIVAGLPQL